MKIPVFVEIPSEAGLIDSALAERAGAPRGILPATNLPSAVEIDPQFAAIPIASGRIAARLEALHPNHADHFAVHGSLDVETLDAVPEEIDGRRVLADPMIDTYVTCFDDDPLGTKDDVVDKLQLAALHAHGLDGEGVAVAIVDTGINLDHLEARLGFRPKLDASYSWKPAGLDVLPGHYPVGHGTMCAYATLLAAPKATLIDVPALVGTPAGGAVIGRRLSAVFQAIAQLSAFWSIAFTAAGAPKYKALVISNSWGMYHPSWDFPRGHRGRYSDNPNHAFTRNVAGMGGFDNVDFVFAAGNCGSNCPDVRCEGITDDTITGANASETVLTVAGCTVNDERVGYSSIGPGISGMAREKPDVTAYTHFAGSEALGPGRPDKGTSTACPLAAGCIAALRTKLAPATATPLALNAYIRRIAQPLGNNGWNAETGHGIINPIAVARELDLLLTG